MSKTAKKGIYSWMLFDWAAQPYHTVLITFIFAPYFTSKVAPNPVEGQAIWGQAMGIGGIIIAILAPFLGAMADATGPRKPWIGFFSLLVIIGASFLWFATAGTNSEVTIALASIYNGTIAPIVNFIGGLFFDFLIAPLVNYIFIPIVNLIIYGINLLPIIDINFVKNWTPIIDGQIEPISFILIAFIIGLIGIEFSAVFTNSMMPSLVKREDLGKLSGSGWALGYVGGIIALMIVLLLMVADPDKGTTLIGIEPIFGFDASQYEGERATGPLTAIWFLIFILPLFLFTPDIAKQKERGQAVKRALLELLETVKQLPKRSSYFSFLITSMFYRDGLNGLFMFGGIYAAGVLKMSITQVGIFGILAGIAGALGAFIGGRMDDKFGPKAVVFTSCWLLIFACIIVVSTTPNVILFIFPVQSGIMPIIIFYLAGSLIGASGGALQAASRTLLIDQVEKKEATKAFGLYALTGRATSFVAPLSIAYVTTISQSQRIGVTPIIALLLIGALGLAFVKQRQP